MALDKRFDVYFLGEARDFLQSLSKGEKEEILADIKAATQTINSTLFKKLSNEIWEFRSKYGGRQFRMLAFWDKKQKAMVIATHGFIKKTQKVPQREIERAEQIMRKYYMNI
ncbi:MAG: type II toxin-antitoxin system RelE/ParE family toxin [Paludibacteraceae bacterium]|nr:type II toxin-antitoxin system RelE/ParE family toxin [Paludibacteraceae bacterium]